MFSRKLIVKFVSNRSYKKKRFLKHICFDSTATLKDSVLLRKRPHKDFNLSQLTYNP